LASQGVSRDRPSARKPGRPAEGRHSGSSNRSVPSRGPEDGGLGSDVGSQVACEGGRDRTYGRQGCQKLGCTEPLRPIPGERFLRSGGSGRRRRETSCPSIHRGSASTTELQIGREPRARVQVDRLVGWHRSVGRILICNGRSQLRGSLQRADAPGRQGRSEPVRHASRGTLQIHEKQTTKGVRARRVRTRPKASRLEAVCALHGVHAPRAWSCGFFKAARRLGPSVWCLQGDFETSEMGSSRSRLFQPPRRGGSAVGRYTGS
jgi:hypothetical protein